MDEDPFSGLGLRPVEMADRALITSCFASLNEPLSDYTFSQLYTWRNSLKILWKTIRGHLCVFANGTGDLTLLMPPIGDTGSDAALAEAFEVMDTYNARRGVLDRSRVEYVSDELMARVNGAGHIVEPMGADYVYDVNRMIDLAGGDLASKRQAKNRFIRNYRYRVEPYVAREHRDACLALLDEWKIHQDAQHLEESNANAVKRSKESIATALCLDTAEELGLKGMVVFVEPTTAAATPEIGIGKSCLPVSPAIRAFTFGEYLGNAQSSITIEKTDLEVKGLAQFIFSEFCRLNWADRPLVNVGDDWGLESLAWTKQSYRPVKLLNKHVLRKVPAVVSGPSCLPVETPAKAPQQSFMPIHEPTIRKARKEDLSAAMAMESSSFTAFGLNKRQFQYHQQRDSSIFLVAEQAEQVVGDGIALIRQHKSGVSGRIYSLVVRDDCRGQRIGGKLLTALLSELQTRGVRRVYLEVEASNTAAIRLYERHGFRRIGDLPDYYGAGKPGVHMMHEIAAGQPAETRTR